MEAAIAVGARQSGQMYSPLFRSGQAEADPTTASRPNPQPQRFRWRPQSAGPHRKCVKIAPPHPRQHRYSTAVARCPYLATDDYVRSTLPEGHLTVRRDRNRVRSSRETPSNLTATTSLMTARLVMICRGHVPIMGVGNQPARMNPDVRPFLLYFLP